MISILIIGYTIRFHGLLVEVWLRRITLVLCLSSIGISTLGSYDLPEQVAVKYAGSDVGLQLGGGMLELQ